MDRMIGDCSSCPYRDRTTVFPRGATSGRVGLCIVGEAPGREEELRGAPFVGPSGQILLQSLRTLQADPTEIYLTNAVMCRPPRGAPNARAIRACQERLHRELRGVLSDRSVLVLLGNAALEAVLGRRGISRERGVLRDFEGHPAVATYHPSAALRNVDLFPDMWHDLERAVQIGRGEFTPLEIPYDDYIYVTTPAWFDALCRRLEERAGELVAIDIETTGLDWRTGDILSAAFSWSRGGAASLDWDLVRDAPDRLARLNDVLRNVKATFHNASFDVLWLRQHGVPSVRAAGDTMLLHYLLDERQGTHGLKRQAVDRYGAPPYDEQLMPLIHEQRGKRKASTMLTTAEDTERGLDLRREDWEIPEVRDAVLRYNGADADLTFRLAQDLEPEAREQGVLPAYRRILLPAEEHFMDLERIGMRVDLAYAERLGTRWKRQLDQLEAELRSYPGAEELNLRSPKQLSEFMYDTLGLKPMSDRDPLTEQDIARAIRDVADPEAQEYWRVHGRRGTVALSNRSTGVYMLWYLAQQHSFPRRLLEYRLKSKHFGSYYSGMMESVHPDGRVRPRYRLHGTRTGRLSSSSPNIHGIPRAKVVRRMFIADEGYQLVSADYAQAEVRMMAHFAQDEGLIEALRSSDIHQYIARRLYGLTDEELDAMSPDQRGQHRRGAKNLVFGLIYGRSDMGLAPQLGCTVKEAAAFREAFFDMMPGVAEWIQRQHQLVLERREVKSLYGRVRRFPVLFDRAHVAAMQRQAVNMPIQSSVSDMTLLANLRILRRLRQEGVPVLPWPHFHDGFIIQVGEDHVDRGVAICVEEMHDTGFRTDVPFAIDVSVGPSWAETNEVYRG